MTNVVVAANRVDNDDKDDEDVTKLHKYCISNPCVDGPTIMQKLNYLQVKAVGDACKT